MIKTMKLKYVLFSGLLLSVGFTACTNEDFTEVTTPVNTSEAIALGDNFTIKVGKAGADTKAVFDEDFSPAWEEGDRLGAAWVHMVTGVDEDDNTIVTNAGLIGSTYGGFYSNSPMTLTEGAGTNSGTFATVDEANLFAGAYVLYYPYDNTVSMQGDALPVEIGSYTFDAADPQAAISENMFSYSPVKFVPGGNQTGEFTLNQVPVLWTLRFTAGKELNMNLADGITIQNIVVEATKSGSSVLVEKGEIVTDQAPTVPDYNADPEDEALADIVKYQADATATAPENFFITVSGSDSDAYKMLVEDEPTENQFIFTTLPFSDEADEVVIKVVTDKGVFKTTYTGTTVSASGAKYLDEFNNAAEEGGQVSVNVILDVTENDDVIYTVDAFNEAWADAIADGDPVTLEIGTDLTLDELTCDNSAADVTVTGDHTLTVGSMNISSNDNITFSCPLVVEGTLETTGDADLTATNLTAKNITINGDANLTVLEAETLYIGTSGIVSLNGVNGEECAIGTVTNRGALTTGADAVEMGTLSGTGSLTLGAAYTNTGNITLATVNAGSYTFTNEGTVTLTGTFTGTFQNNAGATLNVNANQSAIILTNAVADEDENLAAGVINVAEDVTLSGDGTNVITNNGTINVTGTIEETANGGLVQSDDDARINAMTEDAVISLESTSALSAGYIVILVDANVTGAATGEPIAYNLTRGADVASVPTSATTVFVNCNLTSTQLSSIASKALIMNGNITFDSTTDEVTLSNLTVAGNVSVSLANGVASATLKLADAGTHTVNAGASLTLCEDLTVSAETTSATLNVNGSYNPNGATVNVTIE